MSCSILVVKDNGDKINCNFFSFIDIAVQ